MYEKAKSCSKSSSTSSQQKSQTSFGSSSFSVQRQAKKAKGSKAIPIQAKLTIGEPGDKYEQEADRVAAQVVNQINAPATQQQSQNLQREATLEEDELQMKSEVGTIQREVKLEEEEKLQMKPMLQLQSGAGGMTVTPDLERSIQQARGGGQSLANNVRKPMEQAFGADFSGVKIHTDSQADQLNRATQARAFTTGQDVFFRSGEYNPGSRGGQELIAHELTHVVQQNRGAVQRSQSQVTEQSPPTAVAFAAQAFEADFSGMKVHTDAKSDQLNRSIQLRTHSTNTLVQKRGAKEKIKPEELEAKANENPQLWNSAEGKEISKKRLIDKDVRKVNRVSGLIKKKFQGEKKFIELAKKLDVYVKFGKKKYIEQFSQPLDVGLLKEHVDSKQFEFNRLSAVALGVIHSGESCEKDINKAIRKQWQNREKKQRMKVIAHRGDGATFDKLGQYEERDKFDTLYEHANENSKESTKKFLDAWSEPKTFLSGIECDVQNTRDGVPYVIHTSNVYALMQQMKGYSKPYWADNDEGFEKNLEIKDIDSRWMSRKGFISLEEWLSTINNYIDKWGGPPRKPTKKDGNEMEHYDRKAQLRIEIEMKGENMDATQGKGLNKAKQNWQATNKVVSQFLKKTKYSYFYDIAMFNNSAVPGKIQREAKTKTYLSQVTFGAGGNEGQKQDISEWRIGLHLRGTIKAIEEGKSDGKVVTISPGLEHPGTNTKQQLEPFGWTKDKANMSIEQAIQSVRFDMIKEAIEKRWKEGKGPLSLHVLTDHQETGAKQIKKKGLAVGFEARHTVRWDTLVLERKYGKFGEEIVSLVKKSGNWPSKQQIREVMLRHPGMI